MAPAPSGPLDPPAALWARWAAVATVLRAGGTDDVHVLGDGALHHDDGGGNDARLVLLPGGRAALLGLDHEYSATSAADPPVDLLEHAPAWLPWATLVPRAERDELGFLRSWDGTAWRSGVPAGRDLEDGLGAIAAFVLDDDAATAGVVDAATTWRGIRPDADARDALGTAARALLAAARARRLEAVHLAPLLALAPVDDGDLAAALALATDAGLTDPEGPLPVHVEAGRPARRRVRVLSEAEHDALVHDAMRREPERERPATAPARGRLGRLLGRDDRSPEERALLAHVRGRLPAGATRGALVLQITDRSASGTTVPDAPLRDDGFAGHRADADAVRVLRDAERDPRSGAFLAVRVEVGPDGDRIERAHDGLPAWWDGTGPWRAQLRDEIEARDPAWRPSWAPLLADDRAWRAVDVPPAP